METRPAPGDLVQGLELVANMRAYEFTFDSLESVQQMSMWLSEMCTKAHEARERLREKPLESPHMHFLLEKCSKVHLLKKGQVLKEASASTSLFIVRSGCVKLKREGFVYRLALALHACAESRGYPGVCHALLRL